MIWGYHYFRKPPYSFEKKDLSISGAMKSPQDAVEKAKSEGDEGGFFTVGQNMGSCNFWDPSFGGCYHKNIGHIKIQNSYYIQKMINWWL